MSNVYDEELEKVEKIKRALINLIAGVHTWEDMKGVISNFSSKNKFSALVKSGLEEQRKGHKKILAEIDEIEKNFDSEMK